MPVYDNRTLKESVFEDDGLFVQHKMLHRRVNIPFFVAIRFSEISGKQEVRRLAFLQLRLPEFNFHEHFGYFVLVPSVRIVVSCSVELLLETPLIKAKAICFRNSWKLSSSSIDFEQNIGKQWKPCKFKNRCFVLGATSQKSLEVVYFKTSIQIVR